VEFVRFDAEHIQGVFVCVFVCLFVCFLVVSPKQGCSQVQEIAKSRA
jgi:hypothetical protein